MSRATGREIARRDGSLRALADGEWARAVRWRRVVVMPLPGITAGPWLPLLLLARAA